jgi:hypothetical protein
MFVWQQIHEKIVSRYFVKLAWLMLKKKKTSEKEQSLRFNDSKVVKGYLYDYCLLLC